MILAEKKSLHPHTAARYFLFTTFVNICAAVLITTPVLVARLALPLKLTEWPGTWMFIAYGVFVGFGVFGSLAWSTIHYLSATLLNIKLLRRKLVVTHLILHNVAAYGVGFLMGYGAGYVGGTARLEGVGVAVITALISWTVIPIGILIFIGLLSAILGVFTVLDGWTMSRR
ncbi:hypothetical protein CSUB_C0220 [Candidatus Caldarchaeum subterraneum]|uniref:Uncharacterized protein n=1 Tax=Caldiarchaeum subterraneum TaxID=311458 RepID=E6N4N4_CALS0|nr:hypothetical protein HGMM_F15E11C27 [Candidatus Caldarchaeum subterraneum]BAJ50081.1 hypothetical protein CSUB_C0220 [Candidatus Caldarchaeum subterraneum]